MDPGSLAQRLLEAAFDPTLLLRVAPGGVDGCQDANEAACRLLGYSREELRRLPLGELAPLGEPLLGPGDADALLARGTLVRATRLRARDGRILPVEVRSALLEPAPGGGLALSVLRERSARGLADAAEHRYLALLDMAPDAILIASEGHRIVFWNQGAERTYGYTQAEALGRPPRELLRTRDHAPPVPVSVGDTVEKRGSWEGEVTHTCKDGREIRVASRWLALRNDQGRLLGVLGINRDMTEQARAREQVQRLRWLESVRRLAAGLAHDFNNRLAVILSCAEELQLGLPASSPQLRDLADDILAAGTGFKELTRQLVSFAHAPPDASATFDLNEVVRRCVLSLREALPARTRLEVALAPSLWPVTCDSAGVERALLNLALNARDALPGGGQLTLASANVEVDAALVAAHPFLRRGPHVRLTVADTGAGMTAEARAHAFEPFFTTKPHGQGLGLGLAAAYGLVKQSGGYVVLESEPGRGTALELYFPRAEG
jgi:two-component system, cell cycle sensor histidine kinase and response regulator CckA